MANNIDLEYLCVNLGNLSGMPIRLYEQDKQLFYYSIVSLPKDPFSIYIKDVFEITKHVGYFIAPYDYYYGIINFGNKRIVVGPTRQIPITNQDLKDIAFNIGVQHLDVDSFIQGMKSIVPMPLTSVLQILSTFNHVLNNGEKLSLTDIAIYDYEQEKMVDLFTNEEVTKRVNVFLKEENSYLHNTMDIEQKLLKMVRNGDLDGLKKFLQTMPAVRSGVFAQDELRQAKNLLIVTATLISREAIYGGMDVEDALTLSDSYMQKSELLNSTIAVTNLNYRMIIDYTERMQQLRYGNNPTELVIEINNYIQHHLSDSIKVEDIAKSLNRGRSRISTNFKKETGENLSDYLIKQKINEAKRLLYYTDKTSIEIAFYLGFSSQSHFLRNFKKFTALTPKEYRVSLKK